MSLYGWHKTLGEICMTPYKADRVTVYFPNGDFVATTWDQFEQCEDGAAIWDVAVQSYLVKNPNHVAGMQPVFANAKTRHKDRRREQRKHLQKGGKPFLTAADLVMLREMKIGL